MRQLIVNADDLGASIGVNRGIAQAWQHGVVTSASLMVDGSAAAEAAEWARATPALSVGLHLDLAEWEYVGGQWRARYTRVDTGNPEEVRREVDRQIGAFLRLLGQAPTHLDSHQHVHRDEPVCHVLNAVGDRLGVPVRGRADNEVGYRGDFYGQTGKANPTGRPSRSMRCSPSSTSCRKERPSSVVTPVSSTTWIRPTGSSGKWRHGCCANRPSGIA